jgi:hypothetical protein
LHSCVCLVDAPKGLVVALSWRVLYIFLTLLIYVSLSTVHEGCMGIEHALYQAWYTVMSASGICVLFCVFLSLGLRVWVMDRAQGNQLFKEGHYEEAMRTYGVALRMIEHFYQVSAMRVLSKYTQETWNNTVIVAHMVMLVSTVPSRWAPEHACYFPCDIGTSLKLENHGMLTRLFPSRCSLQKCHICSNMVY